MAGGYRDDARRTCSSCGAAFGDDDLAPDSRGGLRCPGCGALAETAAYERRAGESRARERRTRRVLVAGGATALAVAGGGFSITMERAHRRELALREADAAMRAALEPARRVLDGFAGGATVPCDDDDLRANAAVEPAPWLVGSLHGIETFDWDRGERSSPLLRWTSADEAGTAVHRVERSRHLVVIFARSDSFQHWNGHVVVVDRRRRQALCWAPLDIDGARGHFTVDESRLYAAAVETLATITKVLKLGR